VDATEPSRVRLLKPNVSQPHDACVVGVPAAAGETRNEAASAAMTTPVMSAARRLDVLLMKVLLPLEVLAVGE
jgi:hypothetical protein